MSVIRKSLFVGITKRRISHTRLNPAKRQRARESEREREFVCFITVALGCTLKKSVDNRPYKQIGGEQHFCSLVPRVS